MLCVLLQLMDENKLMCVFLVSIQKKHFANN